jgi:endonuclease/exonuclease/phosphatase family metal-dependent hydrolase
VDAWRLAHAGEPWAAGATVPTALPQPPRFGTLRLDYIWLSSDVPAALTACDVWREAPAPAASDHYAVVADLEPHGAA